MDYLEFCTSCRFSLSWNSLKYKYENGIKSDEFSLYQLLADEVYLLALNLGYNYKECEALARVHGFVFCNYGFAGWNAIKEYFTLSGILVDLNKIKIEIAKAKAKGVKNLADDNFYALVEEMFSAKPKTKEVKLVLQCYRIIKGLQPLKNSNIKLYYDLVQEGLNDLKEETQKNNEVAVVDLQKYITQNMPKFNRELEASVKADYFKNIESTIKEYKQKYPNETFERIIYKTVYSLIDD